MYESTIEKIKINREELRDKIYACWVGKNIGGTIGTPYEGCKEMQDITGFASPPGEPLPNDDLDLQLVWLIALEQVGPWNLTAAELSEYWLSLIPPSWNEYGNCKANLHAGFLPPISGELENGAWKHSNGAWIRSEIWACLAPGYSGISRRYALQDAMVDHGIAEGTYAEIFTATMQSEAFFCNDLRALIASALAQIPEDCRVAKAVRTVLESYDNGVDYREVRNLLVEQSKDIGYFQAPANVGYAVIGLLYGEGDFKKSLIYATNCGDDTDCTAATVGATLGIMHGSAGIPKDWQAYIGDRIITKSVNGGYHYWYPETCTALTERVMNMIPGVFLANNVLMEYTDGETEVSEEREKYGVSGRELLDRSPYSFDIAGTTLIQGRVTYDGAPFVEVGDTLGATLEICWKEPDARTKNWGIYGPYWVNLEVRAPEGWEAKYQRRAFFHHTHDAFSHLPHHSVPGCRFRIELTPTANVQADNTAVLIIRAEGTVQTLAVPLKIGGK